MTVNEYFFGEGPLRKSKVCDDMTNDYPSNFRSSWTGVTKKCSVRRGSRCEGKLNDRSVPSTG